MALLNPYLNFSGNCREAMTFYQNAFGGDELQLMTIGENPDMAAQMPAGFSDKIMHSSLQIGGVTLMASDLQNETPNKGNTVQLCLNCESEHELNRLFSTLSVGGKVKQPLAQMLWGGKYGEIIDQFGMHWLFNFQLDGGMNTSK
ncbi:MAG: VOC family protein [Saprospiraceae bacterium]